MITLERIESTRKALAEMTLPKRVEVSNQEAIRELAPAIRDMQGRGFSIAQIVDALVGLGWKISVYTLKNFLHRASDAQSKPAGKAQDGKRMKRRATELQIVDVASLSSTSIEVENTKAPQQSHLPEASTPTPAVAQDGEAFGRDANEEINDLVVGNGSRVDGSAFATAQ